MKTNQAIQNECRISRKCYWHFVTPKVCGSFWYYAGRVFLNLLYETLFIFLRSLNYFHSDVSGGGSRRGCCKYSLTNKENLKGERLWKWLISWFVNIQVHSASSQSKSITIVGKFKVLLYFWILTCFPMCSGNSSERVITYFSYHLKCLSRSGVFKHVPPQLVCLL